MTLLHLSPSRVEKITIKCYTEGGNYKPYGKRYRYILVITGKNHREKSVSTYFDKIIIKSDWRFGTREKAIQAAEKKIITLNSF